MIQKFQGNKFAIKLASNALPLSVLFLTLIPVQSVFI